MLLGAVLFLFDKCGGYFSNKKGDKLKENVNLAINAVKEAEADKTVNDIDRAVKVEQLKVAVQEAVNASDATDAAKQATNAALANVNAAVAANRPVGTSAEDVRKQLDGLNIE